MTCSPTFATSRTDWILITSLPVIGLSSNLTTTTTGSGQGRFALSLNKVLRLERPLINFDLETTSADPATARIVQFAMRVYRPNGFIEEYQTLVNPTVPIPKDSSDTHGITEEVLRVGCARCRGTFEIHPWEKCDRHRPVPRFSDIGPHLYNGFKDADFAGYNLKTFDMKVMDFEFDRIGISFDYSRAYIIDGLRLWQKLEPRSLTDAVEYFGKEKLEGAHDAMNDVRGAEVAIVGQFTGHQRSSILPRTPREIHQWCYDPNVIDSDNKFKFINGEAHFNFGKHKDEPVKRHLDFIQWMLRPQQTFTPEVKRWCRKFLAGDYPKQDLLSQERMDGET